MKNKKILDNLSIVVLSHNRKDELIRNIPQLCRDGLEAGYELIVVDNASHDGSREFLLEVKEKYPNLRTIFNLDNLGVAGGRNSGWVFVNNDYLLNIDDDCRIELDEILKLRDLLAARPEVGVISPRIIHAGTRASQCDFGSEECSIGNFHGACHIVRVRAIRQVGEVDRLCNFGGEEFDYSIRMRRFGFDVIYSPSVTVKHNSFQRPECDDRLRRENWLYNYIRILFKHFPFLMAVLYGFRFSLLHIRTALPKYGISFCFILLRRSLGGALTGRRAYSAITRNVVEFYSNHRIRPEYGNVPLLIKVSKWLMIRFAASS